MQKLALFLSFLIGVPAWTSTLETWKAREEAAATASKRAHFAEAEQLLQANEKFAETFPPKDARLPRTLFDLAEIYRAEGKYSEALPIYERAAQIYTNLSGPSSTELADTLDGEGELFRSLNDYAHAELLLARSLDMRQKLSAPESDLAQSKNDLGEVYTLTGEFGKAEPLLVEALALRRKAGKLRKARSRCKHWERYIQGASARNRQSRPFEMRSASTERLSEEIIPTMPMHCRVWRCTASHVATSRPPIPY